jgi:predicted RNase H-like HicB family nuclease
MYDLKNHPQGPPDLRQGGFLFYAWYSVGMSKILTYKISRGEDGFYIASCEEFSIFTQGKSFEELMMNIKEATEVSLEEIYENSEKKSLPPIMMNMDYSDMVYA